MTWRDDRIRSAARGENPTVLRELDFGYAVIGDVQFLPGYSLLLSKDPDATALAELPREERLGFLSDVDLLATAVERACREADPQFRRMNIDILGNADSFVHAHIWPRYEWEPDDVRRLPVWVYDSASWRNPAHQLAPSHDRLRAAITRNLAELVAGSG